VLEHRADDLAVDVDRAPRDRLLAERREPALDLRRGHRRDRLAAEGRGSDGRFRLQNSLATDRRDAYDAVSRVRDSFERVDDDLVNTCTVAPAAARAPTFTRAGPRRGRPRPRLSPAGADVDLIVDILPQHSSKVVT
jgi:hypothetical protein